jgi:hypothetical protein
VLPYSSPGIGNAASYGPLRTSSRGVSGGRPQAAASAGTSSQYHCCFDGSLSGTKPLRFSLSRTTASTRTWERQDPERILISA